MTRTAKTTATVARGERVVITETGQAGTVWKLVGASRAYVNMDHGPSWSIPQADLSPEAPGEAVGEPAGEASLPSRHSPEDPQVTDEPGDTRTDDEVFGDDAASYRERYRRLLAGPCGDPRHPDNRTDEERWADDRDLS